jgi:pimeloyl-ACP methyl ester carboxylesterase
MLTEKRFEARRLAFNYAIGPQSGPPLVMLHGMTANWRTFTALIPRLAQRWQVIAIDLRGHGRSDRAKHIYRLVDFAQDIEQFIQSEIKEPFVLYGHSLGGLIGIRIAALLSAPMRALVLEEPTLFYFRTTLQDSRWAGYALKIQKLVRDVRTLDGLQAKLLAADPAMTPASARAYAASLIQFDPRVLESLLRGQQCDQRDQQAFYAGITCPVLLIAGEKALGSVVEACDFEYAQAHLAHFHTARIPGAGHLIHQAQPDLLLYRLLPFLEAARDKAA